MPDRPLRPWCARCQYPGLEPFLFGTVWTERGEGEETARQQVLAALGATYPTAPGVLDVLPGQLVFVGDDDA